MIKQEIEYTSPFNVNNQIYFCGVPFRMDSYSGCTHGCKYCFVRAAELTSASRDNRGQYIISADIQDIRRNMLTALDSNSSRESIVIEWLRHRVPIHWGGMSDPFQHAERKFRTSKKIMELLSWYEYPTVISTKGIVLTDLADDPEYLKLLKEGKYLVQISLITDNDEFIGRIEPGTPSAARRMETLAKLADAGIYTAVRIQPVIPNSIVERGIPEFVEKLSKIGVKHVIAEAYKVPIRANKEVQEIWELCPETPREYYQYNDVKSAGFELLLPTWRKWQYVKVLIKACHENGITYGAADNDLRDMGDTVCCCGTDNVPGFENNWKYEAGHAAKIAKEKGYVHLKDMQQFWHGEKAFSIHNDVLRHQSKAETGMAKVTPKYAVDEMWLKGGEMSPECIFSMRKSQRDGVLVYERIDPVPLLEAQQIEQHRMF